MGGSGSNIWVLVDRADGGGGRWRLWRIEQPLALRGFGLGSTGFELLLLPKENVATRWIKTIPIKVNVFAWKLHLDRLPTRSNLLKRGIQWFNSIRLGSKLKGILEGVFLCVLVSLVESRRVLVDRADGGGGRWRLWRIEQITSEVTDDLIHHRRSVCGYHLDPTDHW
ncbi:RNA-directed DNA polymerase, eukaryota [Tanacetum coccineum]